ncbi:MAG: DUF434 domain-containing protein [Phycisphaerae bacterium]|nr:DUF434 domain-containing protein [Phycisphaerae bacterium]
MPDTRKHRGPHPDDRRLFAESRHPALRLAVEEYAWLLTRGYAEPSALALVGNRHDLAERQRVAVRRSSCSDQSLARRRQAEKALAECVDRPLGIDGYNLLITVESALSGGVVLIGRDGCYRDLASIHGTYRKVDETLSAIRVIADHLQGAGVSAVYWYLDRPVSNSGRLRGFMTEALADSAIEWNIELAGDPDRVLADYDGPVATSDSWILDRCRAWVNAVGDIIERHLPDSWTVDLRQTSQTT